MLKFTGVGVRPARLSAFVMALLAWLVPVAPAVAAETRPPNLVFIMADDLGFNEVGAYGQEKIRTPHLDRLAAEGLRFTRHYSGAPVCAPARCVLMTGRHLGHAEIRNNKDSGLGGPFPGQYPISAEALTFATVLQQAGYRTGAFGKWGLGPAGSTGAPSNHGFDTFFGYLCQRKAHSFYPPHLHDNDEPHPLNEEPVPGHLRQPEGEVSADDYRAESYAPDEIRRRALEFLHDHADEPFLLYLPFIEPHVAMHPPQEWIDRYPAEWDEGREPYRGQNAYLPHPRPRAAYAAMISHLDDHVGAVLDALEELGLADDTVVIFTSDNGTTHPGRDEAFHIGGVDAEFFNSTGELRGWKGDVWEGGLRVPTIVRWPGRVEAGSVTAFPSYFADWFPTLCALAGVDAPAGAELDGIDLVPLLLGEDEPARDKPMIWEFHGYRGQLAVMAGPWKAVRQGVATDQPGDWELYHLERDPAEGEDLAQAHPEVLARLVHAFESDRSPSEVFPLPLYDGEAVGR